MKKRIYIAGPMRGMPFLNFPAFDRMRDRLIEAGYEPLNPADLDRELGIGVGDKWDDAEINVADTVVRDITALSKCDGIVFLPKWQFSIGAIAEAAVARWLGIKVLKPSTLEFGGKRIHVTARYKHD